MHTIDIFKDNFRIWHDALRTTHSLAICGARAMAPLLAEIHRAEGGSISALRHTVLDILRTEGAEERILTLQGATERLAFCEAFLAAHEALIDELMLAPAEEAAEEKLSPTGLRIATMRATLSEQAIKRLATVFTDAKPLYGNGFTELCEMLGRGQADLALLPIESTAEGLLFRSYDLIERFELHVACTLELKAPDGTATRIALLYQGKAPNISPVDCEEILECRTAKTDGTALTELLGVADACAMSLRRIDTRATDEGELYQHAIFNTRGNELLFATYLALFMPRTVITARYIHFK